MHSIGFVLFVLVVIGILRENSTSCSSLMPCPAEGLDIEFVKKLSFGLNLILSELGACLFGKDSTDGYRNIQTLLTPGQTVSMGVLPPQYIIIASRTCQIIAATMGHIETKTLRNSEIISISN